MSDIADFIRSRTIGEPPNRECVPGSEEKWAGYLLGVEEAVEAAEIFIAFIPPRRNEASP